MDGLLDLFLLERLADADERFRQNIQRKNLRDMSNPFQLPDEKFLKLFRLSKNLARRFIEDLGPFMQQSQRRTSIPTELKIFATILFLAHGSYQTCTGDNFNLGLCQKSVSNCISEVTDKVTQHLLQTYVVFPQTEDARNRIKLGFMQKFNFPGIIGAIDCTHIAIKAPFTDDPERPGIAYYNRKSFYSINVQLICDSNLNILNCNARFPGATYDSAIWSLSVVRQHLEGLYILGRLQTSWLIGDSGYPLQPWLLTPIVDAEENTPEGRYTRSHILARNTIERCNGLLKQRFRCLLQHRVLHYDPVRAGKIIYTCVVLHNLANSLRGDMYYGDDEDMGHEEIEVAAYEDVIGENRQDLLVQGRAVRNRLIIYRFT